MEFARGSCAREISRSPVRQKLGNKQHADDSFGVVEFARGEIAREEFAHGGFSRSSDNQKLDNEKHADEGFGVVEFARGEIAREEFPRSSLR